MNICMVAASFFPAIVYGGPIFSSYHAALNLAKNEGCKVVVVTTNSNEGMTLDVQLDRKVKLESDFSVYYFGQSLKNWFPFNLLYGFIKEIRFSDIVHIQAIFNYTTVIAIIISSVLRKPIVLSPRGCLGDWAMSHRRILKLLWIWCFVVPASKRIVFHVTSIQEKQEVFSMFGDVETVIIPNGISLEEFENIQSISKGDFFQKFCCPKATTTKCLGEITSVVVSMGRLHPKKGLDILISAFSEFLLDDSGSILAIAGPDEGDGKRLTELAISLGVSDRVFFVGLLSGSERLEFLANADVFVLPSHNENFGNVYLESLLSGTPIIASKNTPWSLVEEYKCGRWVENSVQGVRESILDVLKLDSGVSERCKELASGFTWGTIATSFYEEYKRLI